jgi:predicted nucleotidyltransferase
LIPVNLMISNEKINILKNILVKTFSPYLIYIFGSTVKNRDRGESSDVDIAILTDEKVDEYELFILSQKLADNLKKDVDLVDLNKASTVFKIQIIKTGKLIYNSDNLEKMYFQMRTMKDYAILNEERKEVIDKIKSRGARI